LIIDAKKNIGDSNEEETSKTNYDDDEEMEDEGSIPSGFDKGKYDKVPEFEVQWEGKELSQLGGDADWALTVRAHRVAINLLGQVLNTSSRHHLAEIKALDKRADQGIQEAAKTQTQLRRLHRLVQDHHALADSVNAALETGHVSANALEVLKGEIDTFAASLKEFSLEAKVTGESILKMIALIRSRAQA
jgi:hypothetical protein